MLVDSNILVYSLNTSSPKHPEAQNFLSENVVDLQVAHQNIFETLRVLTHPKFPSPMKTTDALEAIEGILQACQIVFPDYRTRYIAAELIRKYDVSSDRIFDAYLTATALSNGIKVIATDNVLDFKNFVEVQILNPF